MDYQKLFTYMSEEHGVALLETDMQEICNIVDEMQNQTFHQPFVGRNFVDMIIFIAHEKDGNGDYDREIYEEYRDRVRNEIERISKSGLELLIGDVVSVYEDAKDEYEKYTGDSIYYKIVERSISYREGRLKITYWVDDL